MKLKTLIGLGLSAVLSSSLFAEELSKTSYYDCGYNPDKPSKCFLYMPADKLLATHTAASLDDYEQVTGVEATFDNGMLKLPEITGLEDASLLSNREDQVGFYYIQQAANDAGTTMFYLYSPEFNLLNEHEAGKLGADNVVDIKAKLTDGTFSFDTATGVATVTETTSTPTPTTDTVVVPDELKNDPSFPAQPF